MQPTALAPQVGLPWHPGGTLLHIAGGRLLLGQVEAALADVEAAIRLAEEEDLREVRREGCGCAPKPLSRPEVSCRPNKSKISSK